MGFFSQIFFGGLVAISANASQIEVESDEFQTLVDQAVACRSIEVNEVVEQLGFGDDFFVRRTGSQIWASSIAPNVLASRDKCNVRVSSPNRHGGIHISKCTKFGAWFMLSPMAMDDYWGRIEFCSFPTITYKSTWINDGYDRFGNPKNYREVASDFKLINGRCDASDNVTLYNHGRATGFSYNMKREAQCMSRIELP